MFQFPTFPAQDYGFILRSMILHHSGFPIRKSADQCLFTAPRSLSQLVTSFFGSWCQGIHLMLFIAWTLLLVLYKLLIFATLLEFRSIINFGLLLLSIREKVLSFLLFFELLPPWLDFRLVLANCSYPRFFRKTILYWINLNLLKTVFLNYLFVLLYFLLYSVFNEHLHLVLVLINQSISFAHLLS